MLMAAVLTATACLTCYAQAGDVHNGRVSAPRNRAFSTPPRARDQRAKTSSDSRAGSTGGL